LKRGGEGRKGKEREGLGIGRGGWGGKGRTRRGREGWDGKGRADKGREGAVGENGREMGGLDLDICPGVPECLHFKAGCTADWVNCANEPSHTVLERSSQDAYDVIRLTRLQNSTKLCSIYLFIYYMNIQKFRKAGCTTGCTTGCKV